MEIEFEFEYSDIFGRSIESFPNKYNWEVSVEYEEESYSTSYYGSEKVTEIIPGSITVYGAQFINKKGTVITVDVDKLPKWVIKSIQKAADEEMEDRAKASWDIY